jgi:hypothetical protein
MANLPSTNPGPITVEETQYKAAVSEYLAQRLGSKMNFLIDKQDLEKQFFVNGVYSQAAPHLPIYGVDGQTVFTYQAEIFNVWMFHHTPGSGSITAFDIQYSTSPGAGWTSIFAQLPTISSSAVPFAWIGVGGSVSGCVAPILTSTTVSIPAGASMRCVLTSVQTGSAEGCGIIVQYRHV